MFRDTEVVTIALEAEKARRIEKNFVSEVLLIGSIDTRLDRASDVYRAVDDRRSAEHAIVAALAVREISAVGFEAASEQWSGARFIYQDDCVLIEVGDAKSSDLMFDGATVLQKWPEGRPSLTIREAAIELADRFGLDESVLLKLLVKAAESGALKVRHPKLDMAYTPERIRDFYDLVGITDLNIWLKFQDSKWRLSVPGERRVTSTEQVPMEAPETPANHQESSPFATHDASVHFLKSIGRWDHVQITLGLSGKITVANTNAKTSRVVHGEALGLINKHTKAPTKLYEILQNMAAGIRTPHGKSLVSNLRKALRREFGIEADPMKNVAGKYIPCFTIVNAIKNADRKAQEQAARNTVSFDENQAADDFEDEDDPAGLFIRQQDDFE
jgi:hypothetical protein